MAIVAQRSLWSDLQLPDCTVIVSADIGHSVDNCPAGLRILYFRQYSNDIVLLGNCGDSSAGDEIPVAYVPPALLAVICSAEAEGEALADALADFSGRRPPVLVSTAAPQTDRLLLGLLVEEHSRLNSDYAQLQRGLTEIRMEYEETRTAMAAMMRTLGNRPVTAPRLGAATLLLTEDVFYDCAVGKTILGQILGVKLNGLATVALHIAASSLTGRSHLHVRLRSAESGQIFGSWKVPGEDISPGWLALDLATPIGPVFHTGLLEVSAVVAQGESLALSFDGAVVSAGLRLRDTDGGLHSHALATRVWTAEYGSRFLLPLYWDWEEAGSLPPLVGVPLNVPEQSWHLVEVLSGNVAFVALGQEAARPVAKLTETNSEAILMLPLLHMAGLDVLRAGFTVTAGLADQAEVALWLQSARGPNMRPVKSVDYGGPRWSTWRTFDARSGRLDISMTLPSEVREPLSLLVMIRRRGDEAGFCAVSWGDLAGFCTRVFDVRRLESWSDGPADRAAAADMLRRLHAKAGSPDFSGASFWGVQVDHYYQDEMSDYEHFDLTIRGLTSAAETVWPEARFKIARAGRHYYLEFRQRHDWPEVFVEWPGEQEDEFGPYFQLSRNNVGVLGARMQARDRDLVAAIIAVLPVVATSTSMHAGTVEQADAFLSNAVQDLAEVQLDAEQDENRAVTLHGMVD